MSATEKTFEREPRYLVIKVNDALAHLSSSEIYALSEMGEKITKGRSSAGKLPLVAVVVEQDWPEFELVWEMIKARVTGKGNDARRVVACLNACAGISTENLEDNLPVKELADRYNALQKHCDGFAEQAAFQRDARLGALKELAIVERQRDELLKQRDELLAACLKTLSDNGHLADGDNCTLIDIKLAIRSVKGGAA